MLSQCLPSPVPSSGGLVSTTCVSGDTLRLIIICARPRSAASREGQRARYHGAATLASSDAGPAAGRAAREGGSRARGFRRSFLGQASPRAAANSKSTCSLPHPEWLHGLNNFNSPKDMEHFFFLKKNSLTLRPRLALLEQPESAEFGGELGCLRVAPRVAGSAGTPPRALGLLARLSL